VRRFGRLRKWTDNSPTVYKTGRNLLEEKKRRQTKPLPKRVFGTLKVMETLNVGEKPGMKSGYQ